MNHRDHQELFATSEVDLWATRAGMHADERAIIERYLKPEARTLEAGCAGGRILLELWDMGFRDLTGFDYVPELVAAARERAQGRTIQYDVQDARQLMYADASFDQLLYLQQIMCFIEGADQRRRAMSEAFRILRPGGIAAFSFLCDNVRRGRWKYLPMRIWLRMLRTLTRAPRTRQMWPWLRLGGRFHWGALLDRGPWVYWYRPEEAAAELEAVGFRLVGIGTQAQVKAGQLAASADELRDQPAQGAIFCVCTK